MISDLAKALKIPDIRKKLLITFAVLALYRFLAHIPVPTANLEALKALFDNSQFASFLNLFAGGGLRNLSIVALGIGPYINASIIVQLFVMLSPKVEQMLKDEGSAGRQKLNMYTQLLTLPIALVQAYGIYYLLNRETFGGMSILPTNSPLDVLLFVLISTAGTYLVVWLGELITEKGIGNGISMLVFAGILTGIPGGLGGLISLFDLTQLFNIIIFGLVGLGVIFAVVYINESFRKIEVQYSGTNGQNRQTASRTYIPVKINQSGVMPLIFAVSLVLLPSMLGSYLQNLPNPTLSEIGIWLSINFQSTGWLYGITYFLLIFLFTYFYTNISFNPDKIAEEIRTAGGYLPGIRPGRQTFSYLKYVINRLTLAGGLFLGAVAIIPTIIQNYTGVSSLAIGGTGLLIVVSVVLETVKQLQSKVITSEYKSFTS